MRTRLNARRAVYIAALVTVAAPACGDDDRLSTEEFRERGNAICAKYRKQIEAVPTPASLRDIPEYVDQAVPIIEREIDELKTLEPPEEHQVTFDEMISEAEKATAIAPDLREAAEENDRAAIERALDEGNAASERADQHAQALGLTACVVEEE